MKMQLIKLKRKEIRNHEKTKGSMDLIFIRKKRHVGLKQQKTNTQNTPVAADLRT
jgi:hypothetical protein